MKKQLAYFFGFLLLGLGLLRPVLNGEFIMDDWGYITQNPQIIASSSPWHFWTSLDQVDYWPLSYTFYWVFYRLFGLESFGYHVTNIVLHALNALMVMRLARRWGMEKAWLAGLIFLVHPLHVQAVAWIFQFKTLLATFLALFALERFQDSRPFTSMVSFLLSLLAKGSALFFPFIVWAANKRKNWSWTSLIPYMGLSLICGMITVFINREQLEMGVPLEARPALTANIFSFYLTKFFWPDPLSFIYPVDSIFNPWSIAVIAVFGFVFVRTKWKWLLASYLLALLPCLGLVNIPVMRLSFVMDHWVYLADVFLVIFLTIQLERLFFSKMTVLIGLSLAFVLGWAFQEHAKTFVAEELFWQQAQSVAPNSAAAFYNLGTVYDKKGRWSEAAKQYEQAVKRNPTHARAWGNLGLDLVGTGDRENGSKALENSLRLDPDNVELKNRYCAEPGAKSDFCR